MAKKRLPPRHRSGPNKGKFRKRARSSSKRRKRRARSNPGATVARKRRPARRRRRPAARRAASNPPRKRRRRAAGTKRRRRTYRSNPRRGVVNQLIDGAMEATQVLVGKAATRSIVDLTGLPKQGNAGLATQVGVALALGFVADMFMSAAGARAILAGGLTAPIETMIVAWDVPWLATALSPTTANADLGAYVMGARVAPNANSLSAYVRRKPIAGAANRGLSSYGASGSGRGRRGLRGRRAA